MNYSLNNRYIIIAGRDNSIDTISSVYAYNEFLRKKGYNCRYYIEEKISEQAKTIIDIFNIELEIRAYEYEDDDKFILVGLNDKKSLPNFVCRDRIESIVTNNKKEEENKSYCIASAIAYQYYNFNIDISKESAILLYFAIMDKTVNLKSSDIKQKDIEMFNWLGEKFPDVLSIDAMKKYIKKQK